MKFGVYQVTGTREYRGHTPAPSSKPSSTPQPHKELSTVATSSSSAT
jgi:hypothetical protein